MKAWLRMVGGYCKTFWWVIVLVLAVVLFLFGGFLFTRKKGKDLKGDGAEIKKSFVQVATSRVADAVTDVKVDRAVIKTKSEVKRQELEEIRKEPDGKKRRERLASVLRKSL